MKANKFNIGQTVVVIDNGQVTEKLVHAIKSDNGKLEYSLKGVTKIKVPKVKKVKKSKEEQLIDAVAVTVRNEVGKTMEYERRMERDRDRGRVFRDEVFNDKFSRVTFGIDPSYKPNPEPKPLRYRFDFKDYKESQIFENQEDFLARVRINHLPTKKAKKSNKKEA